MVARWNGPTREARVPAGSSHHRLQTTTPPAWCCGHKQQRQKKLAIMIGATPSHFSTLVHVQKTISLTGVEAQQVLSWPGPTWGSYGPTTPQHLSGEKCCSQSHITASLQTSRTKVQSSLPGKLIKPHYYTHSTLSNRNNNRVHRWNVYIKKG